MPVKLSEPKDSEDTTFVMDPSDTETVSDVKPTDFPAAPSLSTTSKRPKRKRGKKSGFEADEFHYFPEPCSYQEITPYDQEEDLDFDFFSDSPPTPFEDSDPSKSHGKYVPSVRGNDLTHPYKPKPKPK